MPRALVALLLCLCQAALAAPAFAPVLPGRTLRFPADFGAHPDFKTEWWYVTGWLNTADRKPLGFQLTLFRSATGTAADNPSAFAPRQLIAGHAALSDPAVGQLQHAERTVREGFGLAYAKIGDTDVRLDDWRIRRHPDGRYTLASGTAAFALTLTLTPRQPPLLQGERGYSRKGPRPAQASYYYSEPQLSASGSLTRRGGKAQPVGGVAWLDHEWSSQALDPDASGWDWVGANLDDGGALMAFQIRAKSGAKLWAHATWRDASGKITQYSPGQVQFAPQTRWRSPRTGAAYPVATRLTTGGTVWQIQPLQNDQELDARRATGAAYWEGAARIRRDGVPAGRAYLELTGYDRPMTL